MRIKLKDDETIDFRVPWRLKVLAYFPFAMALAWMLFLCWAIYRVVMWLTT